MRRSPKGLFITFEGIDGSGKSTQFHALVAWLRGRSLRVRATREPGGTALGERIRRELAGSRTRMGALCELSLMYAARAQHLEEVIRPALARGEVVLSDRFSDASFAYQGYGRGLGRGVVQAFERVVCGSTRPDLTIVFDIDPRRAHSRVGARQSRQKSSKSRFERLGFDFTRRVRAGYVEIARREPRRVKIVNADRPAGAVQADVRAVVTQLLARRGLATR